MHFNEPVLYTAGSVEGFMGIKDEAFKLHYIPPLAQPESKQLVFPNWQKDPEKLGARRYVQKKHSGRLVMVMQIWSLFSAERENS